MRRNNKNMLIVVLALLIAALTAVGLMGKKHFDAKSALENAALAAISAAKNAENTQCPIDFAQLQENNAHIYAWLTIPGTQINYPIHQHPEIDGYYLDHGTEGRPSHEGAIFTEATYNSRDFSDPVTLVYGHRRESEAIFGRLQEAYSDTAAFGEHKTFVIYLPDRELHYEVFAALSYDARHILYNYDFSRSRMFSKFFNSIFDTREIGVILDEDLKPTPEEHVVILSTCLKGDDSQRYLVMAKCMQEIQYGG